MSSKNKDTFVTNYNIEVKNNRCPCGPGSEASLVQEAGTIDFINSIIAKYNIKSINDSPCGLFENWVYLVNLNGVKYSGYDINNIAIDRNKSKYPEIPFFEFDIVNEILPYADLIICRDCFFHLPTAFVIKALANFKYSGTMYLLATEHRWLSSNKDLSSEELLKEVGYRFINLEINPYNLGSPLEVHTENVWKEYEYGNNRQMSLWKLDKHIR